MVDVVQDRMVEGNWCIERIKDDKIKLYYKGKIVLENLTESELNDLGILADFMRNPWAV